MKVGVVGAGGVGGYYGGRLALAGAEVGLIARGAHLAAIRERGLGIRADDGDFTVRVAASEDPAEIGLCDAVLFCVKSYDTDQAAALLGPLLKPETGVVSLQNGVDNEEKIAARIGPEHVLGGVSFILAHIAEPGVVEQVGSVRRVIFGELDGSRSERVTRLLTEFRRAEIDSDLADDIRVVLWDKFAYLCALAGLTAVTRLPIDELLAVPETRKLFREIVREVSLVARAEGVELADDIVEQKTAFAETLGPSSFSSLHHDLVTGHRLELDALHGELTRRAARRGVHVPVSEMIYSLLRPWELALDAGDATAGRGTRSVSL
jgi:2-dehydropantoate 2-reductase